VRRHFWERRGRRGGAHTLEAATAVAFSQLRPEEEESPVGPTRQWGRRGEDRVGWPKATGPAGRWVETRERGGGPRLGQKPEMGQSSKRNSFRISIDFRIWQNFGKLHKEI
jgi:hypothetical protein